MRLPALLRYLAADALRAGRWVAPLALFLILTASGTAVGETALGSYGFSAAALFPVSLWLTIAVLNSEDPVQTAIVTVTVGNAFVVRLAKLALAYLGAQILTVIAVLWPLLTGQPASAADVLAGVLANLLSSLAGVAFGSLAGRPLLRAPTWAVTLGLAVFLVEILVPGFPPVRPIAVTFARGPDPSAVFGMLTLVAVQTVAGAAVLIGLGHWLAQRRT
jgi:hypothetical protein